MKSFTKLRQQMIDRQMEARGLHNQTVLDAINAAPREAFTPEDLVELPTVIPIWSGSTRL